MPTGPPDAEPEDDPDEDPEDDPEEDPDDDPEEDPEEEPPDDVLPEVEPEDDPEDDEPDDDPEEEDPDEEPDPLEPLPNMNGPVESPQAAMAGATAIAKPNAIFPIRFIDTPPCSRRSCARRVSPHANSRNSRNVECTP